MKKIILFGSIFAVVIIILASFPSVASYQTAKSTIEERIDRLQNIRHNKADNPWYPGFLILLLFSTIEMVIYDILQGKWYPGDGIWHAIYVIYMFLWELFFWFFSPA